MFHGAFETLINCIIIIIIKSDLLTLRRASLLHIFWSILASTRMYDLPLGLCNFLSKKRSNVATYNVTTYNG